LRPNAGSPLLLPGFSSPLTRPWPTPALARSRARAEAHPGPDSVAAGRPCRARHGLSRSRPYKGAPNRAPACALSCPPLRPALRRSRRRPAVAWAELQESSRRRWLRIRPALFEIRRRWVPHAIPHVPLVRFQPFPGLLVACAAGAADGQGLLSMAGLLCVLRKKMTVLRLTPCEILKIIRSTFESCTFPRNPPGKIRFLRSNPSQALL
jgi:hypothetical protein